MSSLLSSDRLADTHQVTAILRLVIDKRGHVLHGEVVDVEDQSLHRFKDWAGLSRILRAWMSRSAQDNSNHPQ